MFNLKGTNVSKTITKLAARTVIGGCASTFAQDLLGRVIEEDESSLLNAVRNGIAIGGIGVAVQGIVGQHTDNFVDTIFEIFDTTEEAEDEEEMETQDTEDKK